MFESIFVTARQLSTRPLVEHISALLESSLTQPLPPPSRIILREKDLCDESYRELAQRVAARCEQAGVDFLWQSHVEAALALREQHSYCRRVQMGMGDFLQLSQRAEHQGVKSYFDSCWVSVHSLEEAQRAAALGADALIYGHVFETSCKPGIAPRGTQQLADIISSLDIPVYAIGGISSRQQYEALEQLGCAGACIMSGYMTMRDLAK